MYSRQHLAVLSAWPQTCLTFPCTPALLNSSSRCQNARWCCPLLVRNASAPPCHPVSQVTPPHPWFPRALFPIKSRPAVLHSAGTKFPLCNSTSQFVFYTFIWVINEYRSVSPTEMEISWRQQSSLCVPILPPSMLGMWWPLCEYQSNNKSLPAGREKRWAW